jgi:ribosomal protein L24E
MKKSKNKTCSHCSERIPEGSKYMKFKGNYYHRDELTCKSKIKTCSHCSERIPEGSEHVEFKGNHFHPDQLTCIGNLKRDIEVLKNTITEIGTLVNGYGEEES